MLDVLRNITGIRFEETGVAYGMATDFFEYDIEDLIHLDLNFCFTGTFVTGTRNTVTGSAQKKRAIIKKNVIQDLDYLVIGTLASSDWRFTSHGRKIEKSHST